MQLFSSLPADATPAVGEEKKQAGEIVENLKNNPVVVAEWRRVPL
jgi:hypothetical protein